MLCGWVDFRFRGEKILCYIGVLFIFQYGCLAVDAIDCNIYFFGDKVPVSVQYIVLSAAVAALIALYVLLNAVKKGKRQDKKRSRRLRFFYFLSLFSYTFLRMASIFASSRALMTAH